MRKFKYFGFIICFIFFISETLQAGEDTSTTIPLGNGNCLQALMQEEKDMNATHEPLYRAVANVSRALIGVVTSGVSVQDSLAKQLGVFEEEMLKSVIEASMDAIANKDVMERYSLLQQGFATVALAIQLEYLSIQRNKYPGDGLLYKSLTSLISFMTAGKDFDNNTLSQLRRDLMDIVIASLTGGTSIYEDIHKERAFRKALSNGDLDTVETLLRQGLVIRPVI